ncbi:hypothetical protein [Bacillus sp. Marseille-P3661]|uniref:hypothetical protein n=1 Tax=Bacillus sp. Marseille-P3661 TaxID=1936234 RepID=UPI000C85FB68|nr:hypothetical protein [Bacillus sp. Marseille-P3661]
MKTIFDKLLDNIEEHDRKFSRWLTDQTSFITLRREYETGFKTDDFRMMLTGTPQNILVYIISDGLMFRYSSGDFSLLKISVFEVKAFAEFAGYQLVKER